MTHHAKASSAGSTEGSGSSRGLFRRAFATRGASCEVKGSGARSGRLRATLAVLALVIAAFAVTAAPASAASAKMGTISNVSYTSATVSGKVTGAPACFPFGCFGLSYSFEYSTDQTNWTVGYTESVSKPVAEKIYARKMMVPKGGTKYYVRLKVSTLSEGEAIDPPSPPYPSFTTLAVDPPTIPGAVGTSGVFSHLAKLSGKVKRPSNPDPAFDAACRYEFISDAQFNENLTNIGPEAGFEGAAVASCTPNAVKDPGVETVVGATIGCIAPPYGGGYNRPCLSAATTYHLRLVAENAAPGGPVVKDGGTFTTLPEVTAKPTVLTGPDVTEVSYRSAKVSGEIQRPAGTDPALDTYCFFEIVTDEQFNATGFAEAGRQRCDQTPQGTLEGENSEHPLPLTTTAPTPVTATMSLKSGVTYHLRLGAENSAGLTTRDVGTTFTTTPGGEPSFTFDTNPSASYTTAKVSGTVTHGLGFENERLSAVFEYAEAGTGNFCEGCSGSMLTPSGAGPKTVFYEFTGLNPDTEYEFRMHFESLDRGDSSPFNPEPNPTATTKHLEKPTATIDPVTTFTATTAHFSGTVDPHAPAGPLDGLGKAAYKTDWHFECTPGCPGPGGEPFSGTVEGEEGAQPVSIDTIDLHANTFYEVKLVAHNQFYTVETPIVSFQTPLVLAAVKALEGASDGKGGYVLQGIVNSNNSKLTSCLFEYGTTATYPNTYQAPCLPNPSGPNEVQNVGIDATEGQFKLSFRGQTTGDLPFNATSAEVQIALRALSSIGVTGVNVTGTPGAYVITFVGKLAGANVEPIKTSDGTTPLGGGGGASVSTATEGGIDHPVAIEAHVENLTVGSRYHFRIFATNAAGTASTVDREFVPTLDPPENCPNAQQRKENSSLALPECRAYEQVSAPEKSGIAAKLQLVSAVGDAVRYYSGAGNIAGSGQGGSLAGNIYVSVRSDSGWKTLANLNGPKKSVYAAPDGFLSFIFNAGYSADLRSSLWSGNKNPQFSQYSRQDLYLHNPDGTFTKINKSSPPQQPAGNVAGANVAGASDDLSHVVVNGQAYAGNDWGPGVYEFIGTETELNRIDLDNSGNPVPSCAPLDGTGHALSRVRSVSSDGRVVVFAPIGGCGGANPAKDELWARVGGTTSFDVSASQCNRGDCNAPAAAAYQGAAKDGSRVFFTTTQQLVNGDTDQTNDLYACDIPSGNPAPGAGKANPCSAFRQISIAETGAAEVEKVFTLSEDGSTVLFTAKGVLASNEDALEEQAVPGDQNLYVWRQDSAHPNGQVTFVAGFASDDLVDNYAVGPQSTPDGRYLVITTPSQLLDTDTDNGRDVYRYNTDNATLTRVSIGTSGGSGNADGFDVKLARGALSVSNDGEAIVFTTNEPLSPLDGNGESDVYLWRAGRAFLITTGAVGGGSGVAAISGSGRDVYFNTSAALTPSDLDIVGDVYDARVEGGFKVPEVTPCTGETCQSPATPAPVTQVPNSSQPNAGNPPPPKRCPKGKTLKKGKCVKKPHKKHHKKSQKKNKRPAQVNGGGAK